MALHAESVTQGLADLSHLCVCSNEAVEKGRASMGEKGKGMVASCSQLQEKGLKDSFLARGPQKLFLYNILLQTLA